MSRYDGREILRNQNLLYSSVFKKRGVNFIRQYSSPTLKYPTVDQMAELQTIGYIWGIGDRFYKLAAKYYGDPTLWYIIAWYNQTPTEGHVEQGQTVYVPLPLEKIRQFLEA